jgi:transposase
MGHPLLQLSSRLEGVVPRVWVGVDIGKLAHHVAAVDHAGRVVLSRRVHNDEPDIAQVIMEVAAAGTPVCWAVDVTTGLASLLLAMLRQHGFEIRYIAGIVEHRMAAAFTGEHKTDARDAAVLARTARLRPDLPVLQPVDELLTELRLLINRRAELSLERIGAIQRLRQLLTGISPALERAMDVRCKGPLTILGFWQTPAAIRAAGAGSIELLLRRALIPKAAHLADAVVAAANCQFVEVPAQASAATLVGELAADVLTFDRRLTTIGQQITDRCARHPLADIILSLPGFGPLLTAELLVHSNGMRGYTSPAKLAAHAGLIPITRQTGTTFDGVRRPTRYHRGLRRVFWYSAFAALRGCPASKAFYDRKRAEGKHHQQAILALARRRVDVLWAMARDGTTYRRVD